MIIIIIIFAIIIIIIVVIEGNQHFQPSYGVNGKINHHHNANPIANFFAYILIQFFLTYLDRGMLYNPAKKLSK